MNRRLAIIVSVIALLLVGGGTVWAFQSKPAGECARKGTAYTMAIQDDTVQPQVIDGKLCDTLTILNKDDVSREVAFGPHEDHIPYDGVAERVLNKNQSLTITLNTVGRYRFHDHIHDEVQGYFTVHN